MKQTVFIVDDDREICEMLHWLVESIGIDTEIYASGEEFLTAYYDRPGCLVLDVRMKGMSGLKVQEMLMEKGNKIPIIFITGNGDIPMVVRAMKNGATDFFTKPFNNQLLLDTIQRTLEQEAKQHDTQLLKLQTLEHIKNLTPREHEIMHNIINGKANKIIADELGISLSTVEAHRAKVMEKMQARSLAGLIKKVIVCE
ncbi:MAG: response regulator transcription factor [Gammaproteobacteria bacterium]|nr:response regulator transcription factor [Gammaproteobacteria bacterium]